MALATWQLPDSGSLTCSTHLPPAPSPWTPERATEEDMATGPDADWGASGSPLSQGKAWPAEATASTAGLGRDPSRGKWPGIAGCVLICTPPLPRKAAGPRISPRPQLGGRIGPARKIPFWRRPETEGTGLRRWGGGMGTLSSPPPPLPPAGLVASFPREPGALTPLASP